MKEPCWLEGPDVRVIHGEIIAESGGAMGILSEGNLEATLSKPKQLYFYGEAITLFDLAAAYGYGLVKNHCFVDGNKRIALIAVYTFLAVNGVELTASEVEAATFFWNLAASCETQDICMQQLADWLRDNSESIAD
ncbi:type II toxin-antitoxin system death-on-curing family toxin [Leptolyngbya sp. PCC 6406]|uniref:type II toxin-antitoxin system death-on-curing family toxin n=1 Tax=Leptolyngbya sp. PCC 6406 TaxID=1173264 RepID=UPI0002ACDD8C|nr:type II toxin-antitoxin system death-on-curing family toxin [Leptolyngbya sp. PCC 6406]